MYVALAENTQYDLSALAAKPYFDYQEPAQTFRFAFCHTVDGFYCSGDTTSSFALGSPSPCFRSYGKALNATWRPLSEDPTQGISLTYSGGLACNEFGLTRYTILNIACDNSVANNMVAIDYLDKSGDGCGITYTMRSSAGCGTVHITILQSLGLGWIIFISFMVLFTLYIGIGIIYKRKKYGTSGIESIPNITFWRKVGGILFIMINGLINIITCHRYGNSSQYTTTGSSYLSGFGEEDDDYYLATDDDTATKL